MKVYFAGSIRGGRDDAELYGELIRYLGKFGQVLTEHIGDRPIKGHDENDPDDRSIYERDLCWLQAADLVVAEVSTPSLGVGYEIGCAVSMKKRVLCLYRPGKAKRLSAMIAGCPGVTNAEYRSRKEAEAIIDGFLGKRVQNP